MPADGISTQPSSYAGAITQAHAEGNLYVHLLEFRGYDANFFAVLNGEPEAIFNEASSVPSRTVPARDFKDAAPCPYHMNVRATEHGMHGLSTTVMKKGLPVKLWNEYTGVGLMFDGGSEHFKPFYMSPTDVYSTVDGFKLSVVKAKGFKAFDDMQATPSFVDMRKDIELRQQQARQATRAFWESVDTPGKWKAYTKLKEQQNDSDFPSDPALNETVAIAHLKAVKGIVVYETRDSKLYRQHVKDAVALRSRLEADFPEVFTEPLPIFAYNPERTKDQLVELTPDKMRRPLLSGFTGIGA